MGVMCPRNEFISTTNQTSPMKLPSLYNSTNTQGMKPRNVGMVDVLQHQQQVAMQSGRSTGSTMRCLPSIDYMIQREDSPQRNSPPFQTHTSSTYNWSVTSISPPRKPITEYSYQYEHSHPRMEYPSAMQPQYYRRPMSSTLRHHLSYKRPIEKVEHRTISMSRPISSIHLDTNMNQSTTKDIETTTRRSGGAKLCGVADCTKRAKAGGLCIAHGGGLRCSEPNCEKHAVSLGLCISHGGGKRCSESGCFNASRKNGVCWSHGGKRLCKIAGCTKGPKAGGFCWSHGGKALKQ